MRGEKSEKGGGRVCVSVGRGWVVGATREYRSLRTWREGGGWGYGRHGIGKLLRAGSRSGTLSKPYYRHGIGKQRQAFARSRSGTRTLLLHS